MALNLVDPEFELLDPCPDIHTLFLDYNERFFEGRLYACEVKWSERMTSCAGVCSYEGRAGFCSIRLSKPLLTLRPRKDLVETLLHEMIHAYLFVTARNRDRDGHGPEFQSHMYRINKIAGTNITIYHSFHAEVALYKKHWWRCTGVCRTRHPFFGYVKRATNRAPGPYDKWWAGHKASCEGVFEKIKEPEISEKKRVKTDKSLTNLSTQKEEKDKKGKIDNVKSQKTLDGWFKNAVPNDQSSSQTLPVNPSVDEESKPSTSLSNSVIKPIEVFMGTGMKLGGNISGISSLISKWGNENKPKPESRQQTSIEVIDLTVRPFVSDNVGEPKAKRSAPECITLVDMITCPSCSREVFSNLINSHLDECLQ